MPPSISGYGGYGQTAGTLTGTADSNAQAVANATNDPFNMSKSPVVPALLFLGVALFMLHAVHFREGPKESAE
jgi:uncharacterized membrane protein